MWNVVNRNLNENQRYCVSPLIYFFVTSFIYFNSQIGIKSHGWGSVINNVINYSFVPNAAINPSPEDEKGNLETWITLVLKKCINVLIDIFFTSI